MDDKKCKEKIAVFYFFWMREYFSVSAAGEKEKLELLSFPRNPKVSLSIEVYSLQCLCMQSLIKKKIKI